MSIRWKIFVSMIGLTIGSSVAILFSSILLFNQELNNTMDKNVRTAMSIVEHEIATLKERARISAFAVSNEPAVIQALAENDREAIVTMANTLKAATGLDHSAVLDRYGRVIFRTHDAYLYGDSLAHLPHVYQAMYGYATVTIIQSIVVRMGVFAGAPVFDDDGDIIGIISLGFRLDVDEFVDKLREVTGCEVSIFYEDAKISTTLTDNEGNNLIDTVIYEAISSRVLGGERFLGRLEIIENRMLVKIAPIYGARNEIIGMALVGYDTSRDFDTMLVFVVSGILITFIVLGACLVIARYISGIIDNQMDAMMQKVYDAENRMTKLLETMDSRLIVTEVDTDHIVFMNESFKKDFGLDEDLLGKECWSLLKNQKSRCAFCPKRSASTIGKNNSWEMQSPFNDRYYRVISRLIDWPDGSKVFLEQYDDITAIHESIEKMKEAEELTQLLLDVMPMSCILWDTNLHVINCNKEALNYFGVKTTEEINDASSDLSPEFQPNGENSVDSEYEMIKRAFEEGYYRMERVHQTIKREQLPCEVTCVRINHKGNYLVATFLRDLREYKAFMNEIEITQENLRRARDSAEAASKTKSSFLANMSHEIRTPMNSIIGFSELAQTGDISQKTREYLGNIQNSATWLLAIVNDILDISKIESGKIMLEAIPFDLPDIFAHCQSAIVPKAEEKGISLYCYAEPSIGKRLLGDPVRLRQVLTNLLGNAVKFTNVGTVKLVSSIKGIEEDKVTVSFEVKDSGIGMSPRQIETVFDPFVQADSSITRKFGGTGLGLPITKGIIELMGGVLQVESSVGVGTKFSFDLSFALIDETDDMWEQSFIFDKNEKPNFSGDVLVCEDNHLNQQVICDHLERVGLSVTLANNGKEGVELVTKRQTHGDVPFDLILMDIHMPVMDGLDAASKITELGVESPIVALTANVMSNDLELYRSQGMSDTIGKPFTAMDLWQCLIKFLPIDGYTSIDLKLQQKEDSEMDARLKKNFVRSNSYIIGEMTEAIEKGDIRLAHRLVHTMKSNAGQIGENRLMELSALAEFQLSGGKNTLEPATMETLEAELDLVLEKLGVTEGIQTAPAEAEQQSAFDTKKALAVFERLEPLLRDKDTDSLQFLEELSAIPGAEGIANEIEDFNFRKALRLLEEMAGDMKGGN